MSSAEFRKSLLDAGIITEDGVLSEEYRRGDKKRRSG
jgi:hypothetical protein